MGIFTSGEMAKTGSGNVFLKRDPKGTTVYVLNPTLESILSAPKYGVFTASGSPFNASWVSIGKEDVGNELGERATPKAFIWVLQPRNTKDLKEGFETKMWEASKSDYETISTQVNEFGQPLQGMMIVMSKPENRWKMAANKPLAAKSVPQEVLDAAWAEVEDKGWGAPTGSKFSESEFGKVVGVIPSKDLQRKFLIERSQGKCKTWNDVRRAFGLAPVAEGEAPEDDSDVSEY